ncbi:ParA family protein [Tautonia sociabilis]|uniref:ParA family protein n=1 Tax=Tautonia sociabilis TaxID=2080755 RepID=A0A432MDV8_9BACT|nr:AAA family ATPase [Tautonia sociabilis]RUL83180.1 ParA family protein [Tautonia sociabilis]
MSILLIVNLKGGVAKTTNAVAVAECLADSGYRTLLIDADHQCTAGELLLGESRLLHCERRKITLHDLLLAMLDNEFASEQFPAYVIPKASDIGDGLDNLSVMPCSIRIDDFQTNVAKARHGYKSTEEFNAIFSRRRSMLQKWLRSSYDVTIVDCPPSIPQQVRVFLTVADAYIVPAIPDRLSVRGSLWLQDRIRRMGVKIEGLGTLWSLYREQNAVHRRVVEAAGKGIEPYSQLPRPFETVIPNAAAIAMASEPNRKPKSFNAKYSGNFASLYRDLTGEIVQRSEWQKAGVNGATVAAKV